jgi:hypothetical protein
MRFGLYPRADRREPHIPDFLCSFVGSLNFMRLSLKSRTRDPVQSCVQEIRGISLIFLRDVGYRRPRPQACRGPHNSLRVPHVRTSVARISYNAALATTAYAAFS